MTNHARDSDSRPEDFSIPFADGKLMNTSKTAGARALLGPALLVLAPLQFLLGDAILKWHHARPINAFGALGYLVVVTSLLVLIAGLGETGNLLGQYLNRDR